MTTFCSVTTFVSSVRSMNAGTCVLNRSTLTGLASPGGSYVVGFFSSPSIESSREVMVSTFPAPSCWRKNGWYGTRGRSGGAPVRNEITRLRTRIPTKNASSALLRGIIGGFAGCFPRPSGAGSTRQPGEWSDASGGGRGGVVAGAWSGTSGQPRATSSPSAEGCAGQLCPAHPVSRRQSAPPVPAKYRWKALISIAKTPSAPSGIDRHQSTSRARCSPAATDGPVPSA